MRVLFTTYGFPTLAHSFVENYVLALTALGVDVGVVASGDGDHAVEIASNPRAGSLTTIRASRSGPRVKKVGAMSRATTEAAVLHRRELRALVAAAHQRHGIGVDFIKRLYAIAPILSWDADIVHLGWLHAATEWIDVLPELDAPIVVSCRGSDLLIDPVVDAGYRQRVGVVFDRVDAVHCVSEDLASRAISFGVEPSKVFVGAWGVDSQFFSPASVPPGAVDGRPLRIVSVGRLHWVKGHEYALMAIHELRAAGLEVEYTIVGDAGATARASVLTAIRDLELDDCVVVRDELGRVEVLEALRRSDVFLHPSLSEGLSNATLEAMAVGLPVVVTDVGGMRELVTDGENGFITPSRDAAALATALRDLATDSELRAKMGKRGRQRAVDHFNLEVCARALLEHYRRLVHEHGRTRSCS
jgi:colanic acid/amylovoran biosynthesis glycosyltransferase